MNDHISVTRWIGHGDDVQTASVWIGGKMVEYVDCVDERKVEALQKKYGVKVEYHTEK